MLVKAGAVPVTAGTAVLLYNVVGQITDVEAIRIESIRTLIILNYNLIVSSLYTKSFVRAILIGSGRELD